MSALAQVYAAKGAQVSGSDIQESDITRSLEKAGIQVFLQQKKENISDHKLVIYSHAIDEENEELKAARKQKIETISYPEALGRLSENYKLIAIAGTHGKSTTTAMLALILIEAGLDPSVVVGTKLKELGGQNFRVGESDILVIEACEHKESFKNIQPQILGITNIEPEHLDYYKTAENYYKAFTDLKEKIKNNGGEVIENPSQINFELQIPGEFNLENASLAAAIAERLEADQSSVKKALQGYTQRGRFMEKTDTKYPEIFIDDYAHHPTEIRVTLGALRDENPDAKILCIFQPHQYSRTYQFIEEFGESFREVDKVIIPNIYRVRDTEEDVQKVSPESLILQINEISQNSEKVDGLEGAAKYVEENHQDFDIIITMGAGDITSIYSRFFSK